MPYNIDNWYFAAAHTRRHAQAPDKSAQPRKNINIQISHLLSRVWISNSLSRSFIMCCLSLKISNGQQICQPSSVYAFWFIFNFPTHTGMSMDYDYSRNHQQQQFTTSNLCHSKNGLNDEIKWVCIPVLYLMYFMLLPLYRLFMLQFCIRTHNTTIKLFRVPKDKKKNDLFANKKKRRTFCVCYISTLCIDI